MSGDLKIGILGAAGRMGQMNIRQVAMTEGCVLAGATGRPGSDAIGQDAGLLAGAGTLNVAITDDVASVIAGVDVVVDFTLPDVAVEAAQLASQAKSAIVAGTTGLSPEQEAVYHKAAQHVPVVRAANTSVGVTLLIALAEQAAKLLDVEYDIEVLEMHHRHKIDAPSGTALALGEGLARGRGVNLTDVKQAVRDGHTGERRPGDIGFATLRGGDVTGEHEVIFASEGERITLGHKSSSRQVFAAGAIRAALWSWRKSPGLYDMRNVLGFVD
tara:strand:+ start:71517 stop:72332 length:816 start_codon:yes stop_codon:yes gene_type:complete